MLRGIELELEYSKIIHRKGTPLLISPKFLRSMGAGQIDMANIVNKENIKCINLFEIKASIIPSKTQIKRLRTSQALLSEIFDQNIRLFLCKGDPRQGSSVYLI